MSIAVYDHAGFPSEESIAPPTLHASRVVLDPLKHVLAVRQAFSAIFANYFATCYETNGHDLGRCPAPAGFMQILEDVDHPVVGLIKNASDTASRRDDFQISRNELSRRTQSSVLYNVSRGRYHTRNASYTPTPPTSGSSKRRMCSDESLAHRYSHTQLRGSSDTGRSPIQFDVEGMRAHSFVVSPTPMQCNPEQTAIDLIIPILRSGAHGADEIQFLTVQTQQSNRLRRCTILSSESIDPFDFQGSRERILRAPRASRITSPVLPPELSAGRETAPSAKCWSGEDVSETDEV
ncbi:hypothetical protein OBBRIDRAFT_38075 [Obba rivulosa]|uniref:Uncharacterized protein n=1 Tax=Obba rivulosa TaxID=1052685 RepID=A0A8E2DN73_9APHY|nr:hypothetical protein OBBRIDRAFT_38075 [Obba rivulosa]